MPQKNKDRKQQRREQLPQFVKPLTGKAYKRERRAAEREAFRPQQRELQGEVRAEKETRSRIKDYFDQYGDAVKAAQASSSAGYTDALNKTNAQAATSAATDSTIRDSIEAQAKRDAELRGATYTPSATSTQASANRRDSAALMAGLQAAQGATQNAYLADRARIGAGERREQLLRSHDRSRALNADKRDIATSRKDFRKDYRSRARDTERQFYLEQQQLAQSNKGQRLDAKQARASLAETARHNQQSEAISARNSATSRMNAQTSRRNQINTRQNTVHDNRHPSSSSSSSSGGGISLRQATAYLRQADKGSYSSPSEAVDYLINRGVSAATARKAVAAARRASQPDHTSPNAAQHGG